MKILSISSWTDLPHAQDGVASQRPTAKLPIFMLYCVLSTLPLQLLLLFGVAWELSRVLSILPTPPSGKSSLPLESWRTHQSRNHCLGGNVRCLPSR
jgi:hypothetical protein